MRVVQSLALNQHQHRGVAGKAAGGEAGGDDTIHSLPQRIHDQDRNDSKLAE